MFVIPDYLFSLHQLKPKKEKRKYLLGMTDTIEILIRNAAKCLHCGTVIESKHSHDFKTCTCGKISIDGGLDYSRKLFHGAKFEDDGIDLCEYKTKKLTREK